MLEAAVNTLLLATSNPHKVDEVAASLGPLGWQICTLQDVADGRPLPEEPVEDAPDFEGNAAIKRGPMPHGVGSPHSLMIQVWWSMLWGELQGPRPVGRVLMAIARHEMPQTTKSWSKPCKAPTSRTVGPLCLCVVSRRARRSDPSHGSGNDGRPHHHGTSWRQRVRIRPALMLPEGQTSAELTPDEKTDDPIADKLVALALALGQPDGSPR